MGRYAFVVMWVGVLSGCAESHGESAVCRQLRPVVGRTAYGGTWTYRASVSGVPGVGPEDAPYGDDGVAAGLQWRVSPEAIDLVEPKGDGAPLLSFKVDAFGYVEEYVDRDCGGIQHRFVDTPWESAEFMIVDRLPSFGRAPEPTLNTELLPWPSEGALVDDTQSYRDAPTYEGDGEGNLTRVTMYRDHKVYPKDGLEDCRAEPYGDAGVLCWPVKSPCTVGVKYVLERTSAPSR